MLISGGGASSFKGSGGSNTADGIMGIYLGMEHKQYF